MFLQGEISLSTAATILVGIIAIGLAIALIVTLRQKRKIENQCSQQSSELEHCNKRLRIALEAQESEHKKIAKELYDNVGMMLMTLRVSLPDKEEQPLSELRSMVDATSESVKSIAWNLMPTTLDAFGLYQSIQEMSRRLSEKSGVDATCLERGKRQPPDKDRDLLIYRIVEEAVANALRHSHASHIEVMMNWHEKFLELSIKDDGVGFDFPHHREKIDGRHGLGLYNMENRVALLNGDVTFQKNNPTGSILNIKVPIA